MAKAPTKKELEQQVAELTDSLQRERADADNIRKHAESAKQQALDNGREAAVTQMISLIDNLQLAFKHAPEAISSDPWVQGVLGLKNQLDKITSDFGLKKIDTVGQEFDPTSMQAISVDDTPSDNGKEMVTEELQSGYTLNDRVIRIAMVKVSQ